MSDMRTPSFEVPPEMREMAQKSVQQARTAFEGFMRNAQKASETLETGAGSLQSSAREASRKTLQVAEANVQAAFELATKLLGAKSLEEAMHHQSEYMRSQFATLQAQMSEAGAAMQQQMKDASEAARRMAGDMKPPGSL